MPATQPTERDVNALAQWMHETVMRLDGSSPEYYPWRKVLERTQRKYRALARELLTNPPPAIRKAVRRLEG